MSRACKNINVIGFFLVLKSVLVFISHVNADVCFLTDSRMSKNSKVLNLKDKISGNEVDLSLCNLTEVPVRELVSYSPCLCLCLCCQNAEKLHTNGIKSVYCNFKLKALPPLVSAD